MLKLSVLYARGLTHKRACQGYKSPHDQKK